MSETNVSDKDVGAAAVSLLTLFLLPFFFWYDGYVLSTMWNWFAVPFFELRRMTVAMAIGLSLLLAHVKTPTPADHEKRPVEKVLGRIYWLAVIYPTILFVAGAVAHSFL